MNTTTINTAENTAAAENAAYAAQYAAYAAKRDAALALLSKEAQDAVRQVMSVYRHNRTPAQAAYMLGSCFNLMRSVSARPQEFAKFCAFVREFNKVKEPELAALEVYGEELLCLNRLEQMEKREQYEQRVSERLAQL